MASGSRRAWTTSEDAALVRAVQQFGDEQWAHVAATVGSRTARQCRDRWSTVLNPDIKRSAWLPEEDAILWSFVTGGHESDWSGAAARLAEGGHTRTAMQVKNRYAVLARTGAAEQVVNEAPDATTDLPIQPAALSNAVSAGPSVDLPSAPAVIAAVGKKASAPDLHGRKPWSFPQRDALASVHVDGKPTGLICRATADGLQLL